MKCPEENMSILTNLNWWSMNTHCKKNTVALKHSPQHLHLPLKSPVAIQVLLCPVEAWIFTHLTIWGHHIMWCVSHPSHVLCSLIISPWRRRMRRQASCFPRDFFFLVLSAHVVEYWIKQGHKASLTLGVEDCETYDGLSLLRLLFSLTESFPKAVLPAHLFKWKSALLSQKKNETISVHH